MNRKDHGKHIVYVAIIALLTVVFGLSCPNPYIGESERVNKLTLYVSAGAEPIEGGVVHVDPERQRYTKGETVTLTAEAAEGWFFDSWVGNLPASHNPTLVDVSNGIKVPEIAGKDFPVSGAKSAREVATVSHRARDRSEKPTGRDKVLRRKKPV